MDRSACPENTAKNTKWAFKKLTDWMRKRKVDVDLKTVSGADLAPILRRFYGELKSGNGKMLTPSSLVCIRSGIQRALVEIRETPLNIASDTTFTKANATFIAKCKLYAKLGKSEAEAQRRDSTRRSRENKDVHFRQQYHDRSSSPHSGSLVSASFQFGLPGPWNL